MTLTEARKILEEFRDGLDPDPQAVMDAIEIVIPVLPRETPRMRCPERLEQIINLITAQYGFNPFGGRRRDKEYVCWRQCVWMRLRKEGYTSMAVSRATGFDHATIWWGVERLQSYLEAGDYLAVSTWKELNKLLAE